MSSSAVSVDRYERIWMVLAAVMLVGFLSAMVFGFTSHAIHPPSHIETIDPATVTSSSEFAEPGVYEVEGETLVVLVAEMFRFLPTTIRVPAGEPIRFRVATPDVLHGLQIVGTNVNVTIAPGYVSEFTTTFPRPGEYLVLCNEFCGLAHHRMYGRLLVSSAESEGLR